MIGSWWRESQNAWLVKRDVMRIKFGAQMWDMKNDDLPFQCKESA